MAAWAGGNRNSSPIHSSPLQGEENEQILGENGTNYQYLLKWAEGWKGNAGPEWFYKLHHNSVPESEFSGIRKNATQYKAMP